MLSGILPAPKHKYGSSSSSTGNNQQMSLTAAQEHSAPPPPTTVNRSNIPAYPNRKGFAPKTGADFGDGGAYPEIHVLQYPLNLGKPGIRSTALVPVVMDQTGSLRSDMIVRQGSNKNKIIQSEMSDLKGKAVDVDKVAMPNEDEEAAVAEKTRLALESLIDSKIKSAKPNQVAAPANAADANYIRYTPNPNAIGGNNPVAKQRVIKMVEAQVDPMEPPKHKKTKTPAGPPSPPVPVLHSPPRKITVEDQQAWKVPPCISNWKNARGFIIPLDKRLAADGRGLQEVTINNKFATVSEALYIAERKATEDLKLRNEIRKKMALKEKEDREEQLRVMANNARLERAGALSAGHQDQEAAGEEQGSRRVDGGRDEERMSTASRNQGARGAAGAPRAVSNLPAWMTDKNSEHHVDSSKASSDGRDEDYDSDDRRGNDRDGGRGRDRRSSRDSRDRDYDRQDDSRKQDGERSRGDYDHNRRRSYSGDGRYGSSTSSTKDSSRHREDSRDRRDYSPSPDREARRSDNYFSDKSNSSDDDDDNDAGFQNETDEEKIKRQQRERIRMERRKERERELRIENMKGNMRKNKIDRDEGRDISEKIALGMLKGTGKLKGDSMYDSRLFNQTAGMDAGFGADDDYNTYSKPLFDRGDAASSVYRPKADSDNYGNADAEYKKLSDTSRFKPDKGFMGADGSSGAGPRSAPVQFEKAGTVRKDDPFGIGDLVNKRSERDPDGNNSGDEGAEGGGSREGKRQRKD